MGFRLTKKVINCCIVIISPLRCCNMAHNLFHLRLTDWVLWIKPPHIHRNNNTESFFTSRFSLNPYICNPFSPRTNITFASLVVYSCLLFCHCILICLPFLFKFGYIFAFPALLPICNRTVYSILIYVWNKSWNKFSCCIS